MDENFEFEAIEDDFFDAIKSGMTRSDVADAFGYDRVKFNAFINNCDHALSEERRAKFQLKQSRMKGLIAKAEKGDMKAIELLSESSGEAPLKVEFKRGDMRTPDEIIVTNTEGFEKKSLSLLLSEGYSKS